MRISLNWLKKYVKIPVSNDELVRLIGARLVEVEEVIDETHKYDNIFIVKVEHAEKIPDTHLTLCKINVGNIEIPKVEKDADGLVQVMCGAPNVHECMMAAWIAPGAIVPASIHEDAPFVIGKRTMLKKYESNGMLAAADELDLGDDHEGIIEIEPDTAKPGMRFADVFELNDLILDIENKSLTHRPDTFGLIGFAREVAGILGKQFECENIGNDLSVDNSIEIEIKEENICERYTALVLKKHGEIKKKYFTWMDTILAKSGMRPVDPIVDATNYLMLLTGQPLHAFDYDKFIKVGKSDKPKIIVRLARKGEKLTLLDDKEVILNENDILITSNDVPVAMAGAMGGKSTMIDENTKNIILESATFSLYNLRKTQMAHGIFSEAITRFTKGQPPYQTMRVAEACAEMLKEGFKVSAVADAYPVPPKNNVVKITTYEINNLLGTKYNKDLIVKTLKNVNFEVDVDGDNLEVMAPEWRTDIYIKEDIIEEVGRLLGYDNIEPVLPLHLTAEKNPILEMKQKIREIMARFGANEVLTYSFVSGKLLEKVGQDSKNSYRIINSISPELQYVRQSIVPSLLDKTYVNEKLPVERFAIYEMNDVYRKDLGMTDENVPVEKFSLGLVVAERKNDETAFYKAKKYVAKLFEELNVEVEFLPISNKAKQVEEKPFEPKRSAEIFIGDEYIGIVGEFRNSVKAEFKLAPYVAGFEIDMEILFKHMSKDKKIKLGSKKKEDLTVTTDKSYAETLKQVQKQNPGAQITPGTIYQAEGQKSKNITFHITK
ncbi:phenylalanine--tRNA ligase subunit beta [Candidatus Saccharibacteria bacterium]|nr:phenylalanine--tRNA ligase subunit beta [Candidatus Saccharibacteria bacterium]